MGENASYQTGNEDRVSFPDGSQQQGEPQQQQQQETQDDQLIAGKYKTQEDLEKGTLELLRQKGDLEQIYKTLESGKVDLSSEPQTQTQIPENQTGDDNRQEIENTLNQNNLDLESFEQEFVQNGELTQESYDKLTEIFPQSMVDSYIEGQKSRAEKYQQEIFGVAGGQEQYQQMIDWASKNMSTGEIKEFNDAVASGDSAKAKFAVQAVAYAYQQGNQGDNLLEGNRSATVGTSGYQSRAEMTRDMADPRYQKDEAFRKQVHEKIKNSSVI